MRRATKKVESVLLPSTTIISCGFRSEIARRLSSSIKVSLRVGIITDIFNVSDCHGLGFCKEQNFILEGEGNGMVSSYDKRVVDWDTKGVLDYSFPKLLIPLTHNGSKISVFTKMFRVLPYYGNPQYKKYIEDNNGECPLPLPLSKGVNWWGDEILQIEV